MSSKKHRKKHRFRHSTPTQQKPSVRRTEESQPAAAAAVTVKSDNAAFDYVARDVRRVVVLASSFVGLQILLWYLFQHSELGNVYNLIKL